MMETFEPQQVLIVLILFAIPGSLKKAAIDQQDSTCTGSARTPCINVATHCFSIAGAREAVIFLKAPPSTAFTQH